MANRMMEPSVWERLNSELRSAYDTEFMRRTGGRLIEAERGKCVFELEVEKRHRQHHGSVHGGILAALIDQIGATAVVSGLPENAVAFTSELNVSYLAPADASRIRFLGETLKTGRTLAVAEVKVFNVESRVSLCAVGRISMVVRSGKASSRN